MIIDPEHEVHIRRFAPDDLLPVARLWYRSWHHTYPALTHPRPYEEWPDRVRELPSDETVYVAEVAGHIAAFMSLREADGYLHYLYVDPAFQGQRVGTALLEKAMALCPNGISLHCVQSNTRAREFYEHYGFVPGAESANATTGQPNIEYRWAPEVA
jgi:ribosomal protein S18 acetylase RimI-like enzyme